MMRGNSISLVFALIGWVSSSSALDRPQNYVRSGDTHTDRRLQQADFLGQGEESCSEKLAQCTEVMGTGTLPYAEWGRMLAELENGLDIDDSALSSTTSLRELMMSLETIDFNDVGDSIEAIAYAGNDANRAALREVANEMTSLFDILPIENLTLVVVQQLIRLAGIIFNVDVGPILALATSIVTILTLGFQLLAALPGGPIAIVQVLKANIVAIVDLIAQIINLTANPPPEFGNLSPSGVTNTTSTNSTSTGKLVDGAFSSSDKECATQLVRCHFDKIVMYSMPSLVAGAFLIDSVTKEESDQP